MPLLIALAEDLGALQALLGAFGPLLSSSIQKYTLRKFVIFKSKSFIKQTTPKMGILIQNIIYCNEEGAKGPQKGPPALRRS